LIKQHYRGRFTFYSTGLADARLRDQLTSFNGMMRANKHYDQNQVVAKNWMEAFQQLASLMDRDTAKTKLIFIDELPWMDKRQSGLITALDYFWNAWASSRTDVKLIVCGSSASWMIKNLLNNKKGLYNRVTNRIKLQPFTLSETQEFLIAIKAKYNKPQIIELFMALGAYPITSPS
jgi:AAA+ ATPase superfamily predicted ATPase